MKTKTIFFGLLTFAVNATAQWNNPPGYEWTDDKVRIGGSGTSFSETLRIGDATTGGLHYGSKGIFVKFTNPGGVASDNRALMEFEDPTGASKLILQTMYDKSYLCLANPSNIYSPNTKPLVIQGLGGNVGIGANVPNERLSVETGVINDGISTTQTTGGSAAFHLYNNSVWGGSHWAMFATGNASTQGPGHFSIFQYGATDRLFIDGNSGNVGIGTSAPIAKLHVIDDISTAGANRAIFGKGYSNTGTSSWNGGLYGIGGSINTTDDNFGVYAISTGGGNGNGGYFSATGNAISSTGIYATAGGAGSTWAGYFAGNVYAWSYTPSDRKLKENIRPLANAIDKLKLLKPSIYNYKTGDEYKDMHLPKGSQMGLIAQELGEVFPELIAEVKSMSKKNEKGEVTDNIIDHKSVSYTSLIPLLIAGIQEQQKVIDMQQQRIDALEYKSSNTTGINDLNPIETGFQMSQNEPNPFTHETVVKYTLPQTVSNAFMAVYDLTGKQITTYPIDQKGSSSITLTSEKLAAGIYIYSIVADGKVVDSKRMIVAEK